METLIMALLGLIQGATEFLPVSSSGHLAVATLAVERHLPGRALFDAPLLVGILLHLGTVLAVILVLRREVLRALRGCGRLALALPRGDAAALVRRDPDAALAWHLGLATLPTGVIGLALHDGAERLTALPVGLALGFLVTAGLLLATRFVSPGARPRTWRLALLIGVVQGLAVLPAISRSGATIAAALLVGLPREEAARFSFLLSLPAILGAAALEIDASLLAEPEALLPAAVGFVVAALVGGATLVLLTRLVRRGALWLFAPYVALVGVATLVVLA